MPLKDVPCVVITSAQLAVIVEGGPCTFKRAGLAGMCERYEEGEKTDDRI